MKKYYINKGEENLGPFDISELKSRGIDRNTMVWFFGLENWDRARNIPELKELFFYAGPFNIVKKPPVLEINEVTVDAGLFSFFGNKIFFMVAVGFILGIGILFYTFYNTRAIVLDEARSRNEEQTRELFLIEQHLKSSVAMLNSKLPEMNIEGGYGVTKRIEQIEVELDMANKNLEVARQELFEAKSFRFMRLPEEREKKIERTKKQIEVWEEEIEHLEKEKKSLRVLPND